MTNIKLVLLWVSACALVVCLGMFSTASADHQVAASKATPSMATPSAPAAVAPTQSKATNELSCQASAPVLSLDGGTTAAACPKGSAWTCCRCGGCGCRPQHISPTNWCAC